MDSDGQDTGKSAILMCLCLAAAVFFFFFLPHLRVAAGCDLIIFAAWHCSQQGRGALKQEPGASCGLSERCGQCHGRLAQAVAAGYGLVGPQPDQKWSQPNQWNSEITELTP